MTAKKSTPPSLEELVKSDPPVEPEVEVTEPQLESDEYAQPYLADPSKDHVHTWKENPEHNLAKIHPDAAPNVPGAEALSHAGVTYTYVEMKYADESPNDDKGLRGTVVEDEKSDEEE